MFPINFWIIRVAILATVLLFTIIVLGLSANFISKFSSDVRPAFGDVSQPAWAGLAVATTVFTLIGVVPMLVIDFVRRGAVYSWIVVEIAVLGILSIFWLATAADAAGNSLTEVLGINAGCGAFDTAARNIAAGDTGLIPGISAGINAIIAFLKDTKSLCQQQEAVEAFGFMNWLLLMGYVMALVAFSLYSKSHGNAGIWRSSVQETDFFNNKSPFNDRNQVPLTQSKGYATQPGTTAAVA